MQYPYTPPDFLQNQSVDEIHRRMLEALPDDVDKSEMQLPWDFTRPAAMEKAEFVEYELNEAIRHMFPQWAHGRWLDLHAQMEGLERILEAKAFGCLALAGTPGTHVPVGSQFATSEDHARYTIFKTTEEVTLDEDGQAIVQIQAEEYGKEGNVPSGSISTIVSSLGGIDTVANPGDTTGGASEEGDEDLRERILESMRLGGSFTGCDTDYVRWAKATPGTSVGHVIVEPEWDDPDLPEELHYMEDGKRRCAGAVRLFIVDKQGKAANPDIIDAVERYIVSPNDREKRLAPIGATVTIEAPHALPITIRANVVLKGDGNIGTVTKRFCENLDQYWILANAENLIRYVYVGATLANTEGVADYSGLLVNGGAGNIPIPTGAFPMTQKDENGVMLID